VKVTRASTGGARETTSLLGREDDVRELPPRSVVLGQEGVRENVSLALVVKDAESLEEGAHHLRRSWSRRRPCTFFMNGYDRMRGWRRR
jgi:hypothetical protein